MLKKLHSRVICAKLLLFSDIHNIPAKYPRCVVHFLFFTTSSYFLRNHITKTLYFCTEFQSKSYEQIFYFPFCPNHYPNPSPFCFPFYHSATAHRSCPRRRHPRTAHRCRRPRLRHHHRHHHRLRRTLLSPRPIVRHPRHLLYGVPNRPPHYQNATRHPQSPAHYQFRGAARGRRRLQTPSELRDECPPVHQERPQRPDGYQQRADSAHTGPRCLRGHSPRAGYLAHRRQVRYGARVVPALQSGLDQRCRRPQFGGGLPRFLV